MGERTAAITYLAQAETPQGSIPLRAVESYLLEDFEARAAVWDKRVRYFITGLSGIPGVKVWRDFPLAPGVQPVTIGRAFVGIDPGKRA